MKKKQFEYLTTKQLARHMGWKVPAIQRLARMRVIPSIVLGWRTRLYDPEAVERALRKRTRRELE